jgi:hypothetical protein
MVLDLDWRRISRWTLLGTVVMLLWLLAPVAKCSWNAFRDTPLGEVSDNSPAAADKERVAQGTSFFPRWGRAIKGCYLETPLLSQQKWKTTLLFVFAGITVLGWSLAYYERRKRRTYSR